MLFCSPGVNFDIYWFCENVSSGSKIKIDGSARIEHNKHIQKLKSY